MKKRILLFLPLSILLVLLGILFVTYSSKRAMRNSNEMPSLEAQLEAQMEQMQYGHLIAPPADGHFSPDDPVGSYYYKDGIKHTKGPDIYHDCELYGSEADSNP